MKKSLVIGGMTALLPATGFASETADWIRPMSDISAGDTAWVMVSAILVLFMTLPGLALFYAGMVRKKNVLATMVQSIAVACLISLLWMCFGYSLAFTSNNGFIGGTERFFLSGMNVFTESEQLTIFPGAATIPEPVFMLFQMAFAVIAAAIITGAFAERIKFSGMLLFSALWSLLIYVPTAHWV
ncbi:ammonium transporter, partial [Testudinibacter sp. TR-2022]